MTVIEQAARPHSRSTLTLRHRLGRISAWAAGLALFFLLGYGVSVLAAWMEYGRQTNTAATADQDPLLDRFMPSYDIADRRSLRVHAPAETTLEAASQINLQQSSVIDGIFKARQVILRGEPEDKHQPLGLVAQAKTWGWGLLAETPGREMVFGAVTQPWAANVVFRALPPEEFAAFHEPGYAKIVWTIRADPLAPGESVARTETRVVTTDAESRRKFRRYWSFFSRGIVLIRWEALRLVRAEAEHRF